MFLFDSNLASRDWPGLENHVQELITRNGGELVYSERWPDRKLCYEIKGCRKGTYYLVYFKAPTDSIDRLKRDTELSERILRLLVVYDEEIVDDCQKRVNREVTGSPEEIEERRERAQNAEAAAAREKESAKESAKESEPKKESDGAPPAETESRQPGTPEAGEAGDSAEASGNPPATESEKADS
jgi:small subunit ribosomal protein S6